MTNSPFNRLPTLFESSAIWETGRAIRQPEIAVRESFAR